MSMVEKNKGRNLNHCGNYNSFYILCVLAVEASVYPKVTIRMQLSPIVCLFVYTRTHIYIFILNSIVRHTTEDLRPLKLRILTSTVYLTT